MKLKGIGNGEIESYLNDLVPQFNGVFPSDLIPSHLWKKKNYMFIVNTSPSSLSWGHFVTIIRRSQTCFFLDPLALNLYDSLITLDTQCKLVILSEPIQAASSHLCGYYAILFILYHFCSPPFRLDFYSGSDATQLLKNDKLCVKYIKKCLTFL